jgi:hypothetical protein
MQKVTAMRKSKRMAVVGVPELFGGNTLANQFKALRAKYGGVAIPMQETSGSVAHALASAPGVYDGDIISATIGQDAGSRLGNAYLFDGINDYVSLPIATWGSLLDPDAGAMIIFAKMSAGVWTDNQYRCIFRLYADSDNDILMYKLPSNDLYFQYMAGGTTLFISVNQQPTDWFMIAVEWSVASDTVRAIYNGVPDLTVRTGLGVWDGGALDAARTVIGAGSSVPSAVHSGLLTRAVLLTGTPTDAEWLALAQAGGVV